MKFLFLVVFPNIAFCQLFFSEDWTNSGLREKKFIEDEIINVVSRGADSTGLTPCELIIQGIINEKINRKRVLFFPRGRYLFNTTIVINRNNIILRGEKDESLLLFDLKGLNSDCIRIPGSLSRDSSIIISDCNRSSNRIKVYNSIIFKKGDWIRLQCNDSAYMFSNWARGSLGQILQIDTIIGNELLLSGTLRWNYLKSLSPFIIKINVRQQVGIECFSIKRVDATIGQTTNIAMEYCVNSWIEGVSSNLTNFGHIALSYCGHINVSNSYFHHSHAFGGGGQGYGVVIQFATSQCRVENNIFERLRHAILFQAGSNGNVVAFNYMIDPFWSSFPANSAGDITLHGNFPFANLIEGNINQNTVIDNSHELNGPFNTFYRNRSELYGIFVSSPTCVDSLQIIENEITSSSLGFYVLQGEGHLELANKVKGVVTPAQTNGFMKRSLFINENEYPYCYNKNFVFPYISSPNEYNKSTIPAKYRFELKKYSLCGCESITTINNYDNPKRDEIILYPLPVYDILHLESSYSILNTQIFNLQGKKLLETTSSNINTKELNTGTYLLNCQLSDNRFIYRKFIKL